MNGHSHQKATAELRRRIAGEKINPYQFLKHFWQKKPLLVRGAFPHFCDPVTRDELAGLSCEADVSSRLVMEKGGKKPWQVTLGPQRVKTLQTLPRSHWTLLVQGVDRLIPGVASLLEPFRFIPDWRVDDVMISFAPVGGTVGPHIDSYDVFLIQGQGRRRWRLDSKSDHALRPGLDLRILKRFHSDDEWVLHPGDMLYLPPNLAHYGTALEECLTYSVGFRSPSALDLLQAAQERLTRGDHAVGRYQDPTLQAATHAGEIPRVAVGRLRRLMQSALSQLGDAEFDDLVGEILTSPKESFDENASRLSTARLRLQLNKGAVLVRAPATRMAFLRQHQATALFVNGRKFSLGPPLTFAGPLLTTHRRLLGETLRPHLRKAGFLDLLVSLVRTGAFQLDVTSTR